ncbi:MAG: alkane 1-monooxygenase [Pseudomonadota bacterium]
MIFVAESRDGSRVEYRDTKRYLWLLSLSVPLIPLIAIALFFATDGQPWVTVVPFLYSFVAVPLIDMVLGEDTSNPPSEVVEQMAEDQYYRILLHVSVPLFWLALIASVWFVGTQNLPWWSYLLMAVSVGYSSGTAITVGHELGHKPNMPDKIGAMFANAVSGYGHFCIEHNRGHHTWVATPEDPASARYNETLYRFATRELPGTFMRGWFHEGERLKRKGLPLFHWKNEILQGYAITLTFWVVSIVVFGLMILPFLLIQSFIGWFALTQANYVEHYGLKRPKKENGRYAPCEPHHSWNTNHIFSNLTLFHLQRHSDHHANPMRPYQSLRNFDELPRLPSGYPGSFLLASIPPLWFKVMNPKVEAWAMGDMEKVNTGL